MVSQFNMEELNIKYGFTNSNHELPTWDDFLQRFTQHPIVFIDYVEKRTSNNIAKCLRKHQLATLKLTNTITASGDFTTTSAPSTPTPTMATAEAIIPSPRPSTSSIISPISSRSPLHDIPTKRRRLTTPIHNHQATCNTTSTTSTTTTTTQSYPKEWSDLQEHSKCIAYLQRCIQFTSKNYMDVLISKATMPQEGQRRRSADPNGTMSSFKLATFAKLMENDFANYYNGGGCGRKKISGAVPIKVCLSNLYSYILVETCNLPLKCTPGPPVYIKDFVNLINVTMHVCNYNKLVAMAALLYGGMNLTSVPKSCIGVKKRFIPPIMFTMRCIIIFVKSWLHPQNITCDGQNFVEYLVDGGCSSLLASDLISTHHFTVCNKQGQLPAEVATKLFRQQPNLKRLKTLVLTAHYTGLMEYKSFIEFKRHMLMSAVPKEHEHNSRYMTAVGPLLLTHDTLHGMIMSGTISQYMASLMDEKEVNKCNNYLEKIRFSRGRERLTECRKCESYEMLQYSKKIVHALYGGGNMGPLMDVAVSLPQFLHDIPMTIDSRISRMNYPSYVAKECGVIAIMQLWGMCDAKHDGDEMHILRRMQSLEKMLNTRVR